jgi:hypothetical protein
MRPSTDLRTIARSEPTVSEEVTASPLERARLALEAESIDRATLVGSRSMLGGIRYMA